LESSSQVSLISTFFMPMGLSNLMEARAKHYKTTYPRVEHLEDSSLV
jgi:hypothetical protein